MLKWINQADNFRYYINMCYQKMKKTAIDDYELNTNFFDFINSLKDNKSLYKTIVGLAFIDRYRMLKLQNNLDEEELERLNILEGIEDIEELLQIIENDEIFITNFIFGSIKMYNLNNEKIKYEILSKDNYKHMVKFSALSCIEKEYYLGDTSLDCLMEEYNLFIKKGMNKNSIENIEFKAVDDFTNKLVSRALYGNLSNFDNLIMTMIWTIYNENIEPKLRNKSEPLSDFQIDLIEVIKDNDWANMLQLFINDESWIGSIIEEYIEIKKGLTILQNNREDYIIDNIL